MNEHSTRDATRPRGNAPVVMFQTWHDLCFFHWPLPPAALAPFVQHGLELDTFGGDAWIGVIPFRMSGVRVRGLPPVPGASAFPELNVRTYVRRRGRGGVLFLSLDAASALAVAAARRFFHLPYFRAQMSCEREGERVRYSSRRTQRRAPTAELRCRYEPTGPPRAPEAGTIEHFLTERYSLFTLRRGRILRLDVQHAPWPLQPAAFEFEHNTMALSHGIELPASAPLAHFARLQRVAIEAPRACGEQVAS
jgi:uncharacterized protein YqjF (DUF2071 family)